MFGSTEQFGTQIFDEVDVAKARALQESMRASLALMREAKLRQGVTSLASKRAKTEATENRDRDWAVNFLKNRRVWY